MEKLLIGGLQVAANEGIALRRSLPLGYSTFMGVVHADEDDVRRKLFYETTAQLIQSVVDHVPIDAAADQMALEFFKDRLPPVLSPTQQRDSSVESDASLTLDTRVRLVRAGAARMVVEDDVAAVVSMLPS